MSTIGWIVKTSNVLEGATVFILTPIAMAISIARAFGDAAQNKSDQIHTVAGQNRETFQRGCGASEPINDLISLEKETLCENA